MFSIIFILTTIYKGKLISALNINMQT